MVVLVSNERGKGIDFTDNLSVDERVAEICNVQSVAAAIENMLLAAQELGIGSLWICDVFFAYPEISAWLEKKNPGHGMLVAALFLLLLQRQKSLPLREVCRVKAISFLRGRYFHVQPAVSL